MTESSINFQFKLTNVPNNVSTFRTKQSVKKRIADILYVATPPDDAVKLEYVGSTELTPSVNLAIGDRSDEIYANSRNNTVQEFIGEKEATKIPVANKNFIITREFAEGSTVPLPLYYKTLLPSDTLLDSIRILDKNFKPVPSVEYKVVQNILYDEDTGSPQTSFNGGYYMFNSLENTYNHATGEYTAYYVQYTRQVSGQDVITTTILDNELAYPEATFEDYWYQTPGVLKHWARAYGYVSDVGQYIISLPPLGTNKYAIKYLEANRISVNSAVDFGDTGPWFPRISNGQFYLATNNASSKYEIAEFNNQAFNPMAPYKLASYAKCIKITDRLLKLPNENIASGYFLFSYLDIIIKEDNEIKYALTEDSNKVGDAVTDLSGNTVFDEDGEVLTWRSDLLLGKNSLSGIVYLDLNLLDVYELYATYTYEETYYTLSSLAMNPLFNPSTTSGIKVVYLIPKNLKNQNMDTQEASVMWLDISPNGKILSASQNGEGGNLDISSNTKLSDTNGYSIIGVVDLNYSLYKQCTSVSSFVIGVSQVISVDSTSDFPKTGWLRTVDSESKTRYFKYISKTSTSFTLSSSTEEVPSTGGALTGLINTDIELVNFVDEYTLTTRRDFTEENIYCQDPTGPSMLAQYFILAELSINPPHRINDLARIDVREDGGGLIEDKYEDAKEINPEVQWFSDFGIYDGQVYPGNSVIVVKLPITLKEDFTLDQIKAKVQECVPMGVYPLIRFYGYEPRIVSIIPGTESITITWEKEGPEFMYDIYYTRTKSPNDKTVYTKANLGPIFDGTGSTNTYTLTGLESNIPYIIKIEMQDRYYMWWYGYTGPNSIGGGLGLDEDTPVAPFGNIANFQFRTTS